jgi:hypothetical protein
MNGSEKSDDVVVAGKPPNKAGTIRSIYASRDFLDDKKLGCGRTSGSQTTRHGVGPEPSGRADARGAEGGAGRLVLRQPM